MVHEMQQLVFIILLRSLQSVLRNDMEVPVSGLAHSMVNKVSAMLWWNSTDCLLVSWAVVIHWEQVLGIIGQLDAVILGCCLLEVSCHVVDALEH
jgi:hypothetical protein